MTDDDRLITLAPLVQRVRQAQARFDELAVKPPPADVERLFERRRELRQRYAEALVALKELLDAARRLGVLL